MKNVFTLATVAFFGLVAAQYDTYSKPFRLVVKSSNSTINGSVIGACHQGAAIEGACLTSGRITDPVSSYTTFYHATYASSSPYDTAGILYWNLTVGTGNGTQTVPSALRFSNSLTSNLATPLFFPGNSSFTPVYFAQDCEDLYIPQTLDDTVSPPTYLNNTKKLQNWYACLTRWGYLYTTLEWKVGVTGEPQNPSCQKVSVYRVFN